MNTQEIILALLLLVFSVVGAIVDTYVSYRYHKYKNPANSKLKIFVPEIEPKKWLADFIPVWWLGIFVVLLPFFMVFVASGYNFGIVKLYLTVGVLASVVWDLVFSKVWAGKWISDSCSTWFWVEKFNFGFNAKQVVWWHLARIIIFLGLVYIFYLK